MLHIYISYRLTQTKGTLVTMNDSIKNELDKYVKVISSLSGVLQMYLQP